MKQRKSNLPLFWRLTFWITLCCFGIMSIALGLIMQYNLDTGQAKIDGMLQSNAQMLAQTPLVKRLVREGEIDAYLSALLSDLKQSTEDLDYIIIADLNSVQLYHTDPKYIGTPFPGEDQHRALAGERYFSDTEAKEGAEGERRAFHPVYSMEGQVAGFVMVSSTYHRFNQTREAILQTFLQFYLVLGCAILIFSAVLAMYLGRLLRGVDHENLLRSYLTQNDILNALDEGLVSFDNTGRVRLVNAAAAKMLGHREDMLLGQQVDELIRSENGDSLRNRQPGTIRTNRSNVLVRPVQLPDANLWARQVLILSDRSDAERYAQELVGTQHILDALRANTHEFMNKLQVISGLLQMGHVAEAQAYIGDMSSVHGHIVGPVMKLIRNANVAALILGKEHNMRELDIDLALLGNSRLPEKSRYLETAELVTVLGNLLENAMEAVNAAPGGMRSVTLQITEDETGLLLMVSDTGEGIRAEHLPHIFEYGFSTKARTGRGIGMKLIEDIVNRRGGTIEVDTEPGFGTTISVIFGRERGELS